MPSDTESQSVRAAPAPYYQDDHITIYHGDWRDVLPHVEADVLVTDPPYGDGWKQGSYGDRNRVRPVHAGIANDSDTRERDAVLAEWEGPSLVFGLLHKCQPDGARQCLVWRKPSNSGVMGASHWRRDAEGVFVIGPWPSRPVRRSSVHHTAGGNTRYLNGHPHAKPVGLMCELIEACPPGVILDPFMGSGSTLRAAKDLGRKAIGIELEEKYCKLAADRMRQEGLFG
jgi:site-specific DNA-methyltransferase (adenine-specific)